MELLCPTNEHHTRRLYQFDCPTRDAGTQSVRTLSSQRARLARGVRTKQAGARLVIVPLADATSETVDMLFGWASTGSTR
jgi:hypothetical protein